MADFVIEKKVPTPPQSSRRKYPFADMKVGDSFTVPRMADLRTNMYISAKRRGIRIQTAVEGDKLRVWRVE